MNQQPFFLVLQEGWDPAAQARWVDKDELIDAYGLGWKARLPCVVPWDPRKRAMLVPTESAVILGPKFAWSYALPEKARAVLDAAITRFGQRAVDRAWPRVVRAVGERGLFKLEKLGIADEVGFQSASGRLFRV